MIPRRPFSPARWQLSYSRRRPLRRPVRRKSPSRSEALESRLLLSANVTAYHQAIPGTSPASTVGAGVNSNETILTPANVNSTNFGKLFSTTVDGQVYAEPLYMENVSITTGANQGTHNVVFVATENDSLYAIDASSGTILWQDALLTPEHGGTLSAVPNSAVNSGDISPLIGITATPVIDPSTGTIFVEAKEQEVASNGTHFEHHLYAINIGSGAITKEVLIADSIGDTVVSGPSVNGTGAGASGGVVKFDALRQLDRPALTLVNGNIYLAFASHGDNGPYHGWILGYSESTLALTAVFNANPNGSDDGIWQSGGTLAYETVNGNTYLYLETGNGTFDTTLTPSPFNSSLMIPNEGDYGDTFLKLEIDGSTPASGSLDATNNINGWGMHVADYFTPINEGNLSAGDTDLGSGAPLLLPASAGSAAHPDLLVGSGKEGRIYLIDRNDMGGYGGDAAGDGNSGTDNVVQETATGAINGSLDTPTFYNGVLYYVGGYGDEARTFTVANGVMSSTSTTQSTDSYPFPGSTPTISTNSSGGNAIVWDIAGSGTSQLRAYSASAGYGSEIYTSAQAANSRDSLGSAVKFTVPTVADGEVFVGTTNSLVVYGLLQQATAPPAAPSNLSASAFSGSVINLSWTDNDKSPSSATGYNILESTNGTSFTQVGTASAGATSFAVGGLTVSTKYYFEIDAFNSKGTSAFSNVANATTTSQASVLDFSSGFANSSGVLTYNGSAKINGTSAELTDGGGTEAGSVFSTNAVDVTKFSNQFTFQLTNPNADGFTFTIEGDGPTALGPTGGGLGYGPDAPGGTPGIAKSLAVKFDLYNNAGEGTDSTGEYTDGASPTTPDIDLSTTGINLHSGDVFQVVMSYDGTTLNVTIADTTTNASASQSYTVNIPQVIGSNTGYVGFTGGTGGSTAVQNILNWTYSPTASTLPTAPSNLTGTVISGSEIDISWTNNANNATSFLIDRSTDGVNFTQIASVSSTVTTYHDTTLSPGNTYYYEVAASNAAGNSAFSNVFSAATVTPPAPPTNLTATNITTTEVDLSWTNVATNATGIKILKQLGSNSSQVIVSGLSPTTTSYDITGLTPGSPYIFEVDALNSNGPSGATTIAVDTLPAQVTGVTATPGPGQITISWTADQGAVNYNIYRSTVSGGEGATPVWTAIAGTSFVDGTTVPGTTYFYEVTAVDPNSASPTDPTGESAPSSEVSNAPQTGTSTNFNAPSNLVATPQDGPQVQLTWNTNSTTGTGFSVERATNAAFSQNVTTFSVPATTAATATYVDTTVVPNNTYFYRVQALNNTVTTAFSNPVTAAIPAPPATPSNGHATLITATTVDLAWTNNATNADVYKIFREVVGGTFTQIASLPPTATTYDDSGLAPGTNYDYHIEAWNISGNADRTGADLYTVSPAITNLAVTATAGQVGLTWSAPLGATDMTYNVYRGTSAGGEAATPMATGLTTTSFTDNTSVTVGTTYYYEVTSVDPASLATPSVAPFGESARSNEVSATPQASALILAISAGGPASGSFVADTDFSGGTVSTGTKAAINTGGVTNPPPQSVLQHGRYGNMTYTIPSLTPGASYTVRLDFVEYAFNAAGARVFNVAINGTQVLSNFDIWSAAGGENIALARSFTTTASSAGKITIAFTSVVNNSMINGIELYSSSATAPPAPTGLTPTPGNNQVALSWTPVSGATGYDVYRGTSSGGETLLSAGTNISTSTFTDSTAANGTQYFYYVTALNGSLQSGKSNEVSATPQAPQTGSLVLAISAGGPASGSFVADTDFSGGTVSGGTKAAISTGGVTNPPPQSVLQHGRYGNLTYTIPNLTAGASYVVRLDFVEYVFNTAGSRVFNVAINGTKVLSSFDIWSAAGGENIALAKLFTVTASSTGTITIGFTSVVNNSIINGIEIYTPAAMGAAIPSAPAIPAAKPGGLSPTAMELAVSGLGPQTTGSPATDWSNSQTDAFFAQWSRPDLSSLTPGLTLEDVSSPPSESSPRSAPVHAPTAVDDLLRIESGLFGPDATSL
jgi:fibronectin type 3 domain-containing protein